ncbi:uncharacterized protein PV09_00497 [Verruconis gallopava]|uniref:Urease accessory protein UreF n=1 Tax=Verruconis gallopava TaxID=253628 RepID=A0A0D2AT05_9PEZI|nr:uncharacterized protein PV09_00497 [Verruconis gallopava]KIW09630.1 hypothetical protein PV09_00497 [Verruconis gallopava]
MSTSKEERQAIEDEIISLEKQLDAAKRKLNDIPQQPAIPDAIITKTHLYEASSLHTLLLLADSALPLGSFAFSSGLESFLAHKKLEHGSGLSQQRLFSAFLSLSLQSLASTALPYVLATYRNPGLLFELDNDFDASTPCAVARRASVAQGRALLSVWERSLHSHYAPITEDESHLATEPQSILRSFSTSLRDSRELVSANAHLAPLWGIVTLLLRIDLKSSAYLFLFSHSRTVISAAVRASVLGPYQAQSVLASVDLQNHIESLIESYWYRKPEDAGQSVPVLDLWAGRHEKLYSRIFNS